MENKYFTVVYREDMNDIFRRANIVATYNAVKENNEGRYVPTEIYLLGFDFATLKMIKEARINIEYVDNEKNGYYIAKGRLTDKNEKVDIDKVIKAECDKSNGYIEQARIRDGQLMLDKDVKVAPYKAVNTLPLPNAKSMIAYDKDVDLVIPFRLRVVKGNGDGKLPVFIYLHDEKSKGKDNILPMIEAKEFLSSLKKGNKEGYIAVIPNTIESFGSRKKIDGNRVIIENALNKLMPEIIEYLVSNCNADDKRIYIVGTGWGAKNALNEIYTHKGMYAGGVIAFGTDRFDDMSAFAGTPLIIVSAEDDDKYYKEDIESFADGVKALGGDVYYADFRKAEHKVYRYFYKEGSFVRWLLSHTAEDKTASEDNECDDINNDICESEGD